MVPVRKFEFDCGLLFCLWISCSCGGNKNCPNGFSPISNNLLLPDFGFLPLSMQMLPSCWFQGIESESVFPSVTYSLFPKLFSFYSLLSSCFLNSLGNRISWVFFLLLCLSRVLFVSVSMSMWVQHLLRERWGLKTFELLTNLVTWTLLETDIDRLT